MSKILVISPTPSHPQDAGNRVRIFNLLNELKNNNNKIFFVFIMTEFGDVVAMEKEWDGLFLMPFNKPKKSILKMFYDGFQKLFGSKRVYPYYIDDWYPSSIDKTIVMLRNIIKPDVVLIEYVFMTKAFDNFNSDTLKILDTHDVFGDRHNLYRKNGMMPEWFYTSIREERKALKRADIIIAIQNEEAKYFSSNSKKKVITVGHIAQSHSSDSSSNSLNRLLFVGSRNPINIRSIRWFILEVMPEIKLFNPKIELEIVGECAESIMPGNNIKLTGKVHNLYPSYKRAKAVINPVRFGTGLKIKTIEALAYGCPLITTKAGAVGLEKWANKAFLVADNCEEFVEAIKLIFINEELVYNLRKYREQLLEVYKSETIRPLNNLIRTFGR